MSWGNRFFAKAMIPDHHTVQIPLIKRQHTLIKTRIFIILLYIENNLINLKYELQIN